MSNNLEDTLEIYQLIIDRDEAEFEANATISEYLIQRAAIYANQLGLSRKKVKEIEVIEDSLSGAWIIICSCERWF